MKYSLFMMGVLLCSMGVTAQEKPLDFWDEEPRLFTVATDQQNCYHDLEKRLAGNYDSPWFKADHADKCVGDFSLVYDAAKAGSSSAFGFVSSLWGELWKLDEQFSLNLSMKVKSSSEPGAWTATLVDKSGKEAKQTFEAGKQGDWQELSLPLKVFKAEEGFDFSTVAECRLKADLPKDAHVNLDGIHFAKSGIYIGVTDKPLSQRLAEERRTRPARMLSAQKTAANTIQVEAYFPLKTYFTQLYLGRDIEKANKAIMEMLQKPETRDNAWSLFLTPMLCRLHLYFSDKSEMFPGRLSPEVDKKLLEVLWDRTVVKNDIAWAKKSTWWLDGSENHDLNAKACNLVSSRIFMNESEYKDRIYPDYGFGGGYHYGHAGFYGASIDPATRQGGGRANLKDGKKYNAADHYKAWLAFLKEYFSERARRGFFVERAADGYMHHTMNFVDLVYTCGGDPTLKQIVGNFLDLAYADWAQESISGLRGGMKGRHNDEGGYDSFTVFMRYYLGVAGDGSVWYYYSLINGYHLPPVVMSMALDRQGMGCYEYQSRGVGEEQNLWPRPLGTERTLLCDTESRFLKYSYVTPDYVLGAQMEHPAVVHSHLSITKRWHGMIFAQSPLSRVVTVGVDPETKGDEASAPKKPEKGYNMSVSYRSVQSKSVLITQQARRLFQVSPDWFPQDSMHDKDMGVYLGKDWDQLVERDGWIFVMKGNAYAAIKPVLWDEKYETDRKKQVFGKTKGFDKPEDIPTVKIKDKAYAWVCDQAVIKLEDKFSPVIIEAGRKADHATLEDFIKDVLDNPIALYKTVVPGCNVLTYTGCGKDSKEIVFNAATIEMPTVGGKYIDYSHPMTFDSPYLQSEYKSGKIGITYGDDRLDLNFTDKIKLQE